MKNEKNKISPQEAVEFLESIRKIIAETDEPTQLISIRIPGNLLKILKTKAKSEGTKYQTLIVHLIRKGLVEK